jgi:hypothetical protein
MKASGSSSSIDRKRSFCLGSCPCSKDCVGSLLPGKLRRACGYHPDTETDRFYGGGTGGYFVYDITDLDWDAGPGGPGGGGGGMAARKRRP